MLQPEIADAVPPTARRRESEQARGDVAVIGGGASGTLTAIHLMASRAHDLTVTLHDASGELGKGLAYGTSDRRHLLNVRSRHMSAFPDIPSDLVEWARRTGRQPDAQAFLPRRDYAVYLRETSTGSATSGSRSGPSGCSTWCRWRVASRCTPRAAG